MTIDAVHTVTGKVAISDLGVTLMHEHLVIGYPGWEADTLAPGPNRQEMLAICVDKVQAMQSVGVQSMLDPCPNDLGRDVELAAEVSARTGFNIVCATGLYKEDEGGAPYWHFTRRAGGAVKRMAELFVHELTRGIGDSGICAGIIKVATGKGTITEYEYQVLEAAAIASCETGAPITTHTDSGTMGIEQQAFLLERGVPAHRIIIGHSCGSVDHDYHLKILAGGSYLGFDRFGLDFFVTDEQRVDALLALLQKRKERQIVVSHDSVWCTRGTPFPAALFESADVDMLFDPTHFHRNIVPALLRGGATQGQVDSLLIDNPRRFFAGDPL